MVSQNPNDGDILDADETPRFSEDIDSTCSTPYVSAPSSPGRGPTGYFYSAPASPMHFVLSSKPAVYDSGFVVSSSESGSFEFEFSSRFSSDGTGPSGSMCSADELFLNGQIRPMKLSSHLQRPQILAPLMDLEGEEDDEESKDGEESEKREKLVVRGRDLRLRNRSMHRKARSMSPFRNAAFEWHEEPVRGEEEICELALDSDNREGEKTDDPSIETTPSGSASSSRSSSSGRNSKKWIFLKDLLYRSKSEGRGNSKEKYFWSSISFSPSKEKKLSSTSLPFTSSTEEKTQAASSSGTEVQKEKDKEKEKEKEKGKQKQRQKQKGVKQASNRKSSSGKPANGIAAKRRVPPSPHELHYTANRAHVEEMKKRTFLPYRQGLLGCLGFSSKGYSALNGLTRTLNPVSSR